MIEDFGEARDFTTFDESTGEIVIKPNSNHVGAYQLKLTLTDGNEDYEKTMYLSVPEKISTE